jgi:hypothetical protein
MNTNLDLDLPTPPLTSRSYQSEDDFQQMQGLLMEARSRTNDWHYAHVGELMWAFFMVTCHLNPQEYIRLWHDEQGKLVGYAILGAWLNLRRRATRISLERIDFFRLGQKAMM